SLGCCFDFNEFSNFWSKTATPTFLVDILRKHPLDFSTVNVSEQQLEAFEPDRPDITTLLYQTGYLTIVGCRNRGSLRLYQLDFPNREVKDSFLNFLVPAYTATDARLSGMAAFDAAEALYAHDVPAFLKNLKSFFRNIPYDLTDRQNEQMWQAIVYAVLSAIGVKVRAEVKTYDGRIDMTVETPSDNYIVEFKLDRPAAEAMEQIRGKGYATHFSGSQKRLTLIGISFSSEKRTIVEELVEES
ncbi:MAG: PD-(D/E)XK nuclease domain-containing protein, partial [Victivallales bacterium]|nr:PD-(D/E)XK nuclease domain-containing protein [Victivallales bacterium]